MNGNSHTQAVSSHPRAVLSRAQAITSHVASHHKPFGKPSQAMHANHDIAIHIKSRKEDIPGQQSNNNSCKDATMILDGTRHVDVQRERTERAEECSDEGSKG